MLNTPHPISMVDDFAEFGILRHAYVKPAADGQPSVEVRAADGSFLGSFPDCDTAFAALRLNDMEPLRVH